MHCCYIYINNTDFNKTFCGIIEREYNKSSDAINGVSNNNYSNENITELMNDVFFTSTEGFVWFTIVIQVICIFGIIGNLMNLLVLTNRRITSRLDRVGRAVNYGLVALALSDLLFCGVVFPHSFITTQTLDFVEDSQAYQLFYRIYGVAFINLFQMTSIWLVVILAISRYFGVKDPLHAQNHIMTKYMIIVTLLVFIASVLITLPHFLHLSVEKCLYRGVIYAEVSSHWSDSQLDKLQFYIKWMWPIFANFLPIILLVICNLRLIRELNNIYHLQKTLHEHQQKKHGNYVVTVTLVSIVALSLILVTPADILRYINPYMQWGNLGYAIANIANIIQTLNFAVNFMLYCIVNAHFRQTIKYWFVTLLQCICHWEYNNTNRMTGETKSTMTSLRRSKRKLPQDIDRSNEAKLVTLKFNKKMFSF